MAYKTSLFSTLAKYTAHAAGHPLTFCAAVLIVVVWAICGPVFGYSDTWQLVINTGTTIVTFLMVFLVQNTQNRDSAALQIKVDELIRAMQGAHDSLIKLEDMDDEELKEVQKKYEGLARRARDVLNEGGVDTDIPEAEAAARRERKDPEDKASIKKTK